MADLPKLPLRYFAPNIGKIPNLSEIQKALSSTGPCWTLHSVDENGEITVQVVDPLDIYIDPEHIDSVEELKNELDFDEDDFIDLAK